MTLPEGNAVDEYVATVQAVDADSGENGSVSYSVRCSGDDDDGVSVLRVDGATGVVRAVVSLDRERRADYDCVVVAADAGVPSLSSSTRLRLRVGDVDDERAVFERRSYEFHVAENTPAGTVVGRVEAHDADEPPFNRVVYDLDIDNDRPPTVSTVCVLCNRTYKQECWKLDVNTMSKNEKFAAEDVQGHFGPLSFRFGP